MNGPRRETMAVIMGLVMGVTVTLGGPHPATAQSDTIKAPKAPSVTVPADRMRIVRGRDYLTHLYESIQQAEDRIWIATFSITGTHSNRMTSVFETLDTRYDSGVDVRLLLPPELDKNKKTVRNLKKDYGFPVKFYRGPGVFHGKFILIDDTNLYNGSANLTLTAFSRPYETSIYLESERLVSSFERFMNRLWTATAEVGSP